MPAFPGHSPTRPSTTVPVRPLTPLPYSPLGLLVTRGLQPTSSPDGLLDPCFPHPHTATRVAPPMPWGSLALALSLAGSLEHPRGVFNWISRGTASC